MGTCFSCWVSGDLSVAVVIKYSLKEDITAGIWNSRVWNDEIANHWELQDNTFETKKRRWMSGGKTQLSEEDKEQWEGKEIQSTNG